MDEQNSKQEKSNISNKRYVWFRSNGQFSNSWDEESFKQFIKDEDLKHANECGWKLIEYTCLNDNNFQF